MRRIVVGTRRSALAMTQTQWVIERLKALGTGHAFAVQPIVTKGDRILDVTLSKIGGKGLFVKEIEQALLDREADLAVHSLKDLPAELPDGLVIAAVPPREDPRDALISRDGRRFEQLPAGAVVGTSSLRRAAQLLAWRPDVRVVPLRGNVDTRLKRLEAGDFDAIVLAAAGLARMGWLNRVTEFLPPERVIPAVGQGALAVECRADDDEVLALVARLNDRDTERAVRAERAFLHRLNGGCQVPLGAHAVVEGDRVRLTGFVGAPDGSRLIVETADGTEAEEVGVAAAERILARGGDALLEQVGEGSQQ
ncbi:hydroxymethylbilane synthase [Calditerricola satsumensis]|uniref:Porphobilinogen deaminase n=1 Tax=Calditerricola satsumensis TaxID=373054 RepID=A0A8J3B7D7_9BACI|nr:hydroxymethylbilane synthase [Calditerricola satsumensis]GGK00982.1 porphobilinogen deaminase [Calditerricola satsumensis]